MMNTNQVFDWLADKRVKDEYRARVAALMSTFIVIDKMTPEAAYDHWQTRRPDFFTGA